LNSRPADYESAALPLSYLGLLHHLNIRRKLLSIHPPTARSFHRDNGYIAQPIPMPTSRNKNSDHTIYFTRSKAGRRLRNPNAIEIASANSNIA
jgi:hypothetical protein